jgi:NTE family protein
MNSMSKGKKLPLAESQAEPEADKSLKVALVLQGGGALGAYHVGAFEALAAHGYQPDWVAGISIGAFNAAIIAGNEPADRLDRLTEFWQAISWPDLPYLPQLLNLRILHNTLSNGEALTIGQPNFFSPRLVSPYLLPISPPQDLSFYDTSAMRATLKRFADFGRINGQATRLTLGATNIATGNLEFFDNHEPADRPIGPEHVLASGSLPPGFPATEVKGKVYWDGGCVSNTPLEAVAAGQGAEPLLVFVIDLWSASGNPPETMNELAWRAKEIQYAGRTTRDVKVVETAANHAHAVGIAKAAGLPEMDGLPDAPVLRQGPLEIVHIIYHPGPDQVPNSDAEFSRLSIALRREAGRLDMEKALTDAPWTRPLPPYQRARGHKIEGTHLSPSLFV